MDMNESASFNAANYIPIKVIFFPFIKIFYIYYVYR